MSPLILVSMRKTSATFFICLVLNGVGAQSQSLLKPNAESGIPQWQESLHYAINTVKDTIYLSVGARVNEVLLQEDHFSPEGFWQGVDRFVWEGEEQVRVYHYNGQEELIGLNQNGISSNTILYANGQEEKITYSYNGAKISRMHRQSAESLEEQIYLYHPENGRLLKIKFFYNGEEQQQLRFSYCKNGSLQKEELWVNGELSLIATYSYKEGVMLSSSLIQLSPEGHQLKEIHKYTYLDNGNLEETISHFSGPEAILNALSLRTFDMEGRLLKLTTEYLNDSELYKEVFLYRYPEQETEVLEVLNLKTGGR